MQYYYVRNTMCISVLAACQPQLSFLLHLLFKENAGSVLKSAFWFTHNNNLLNFRIRKNDLQIYSVKRKTYKFLVSLEQCGKIHSLL